MQRYERGLLPRTSSIATEPCRSNRHFASPAIERVAQRRKLRERQCLSSTAGFNESGFQSHFRRLRKLQPLRRLQVVQNCLSPLSERGPDEREESCRVC